MAKFRSNPRLKLMDQVREVLRYHNYRTEQTSLSALIILAGISPFILRLIRRLFTTTCIIHLNFYFSSVMTPTTGNPFSAQAAVIFSG